MRLFVIYSVLFTFYTSVTVCAVELDTRVFSGFRADAKTVGQQFRYRFNDLAITTEFESYIDQFVKTSFAPSKINFVLGVQYKGFNWTHHCLHSIDKESKYYFPVKDIFSYSWGKQ